MMDMDSVAAIRALGPRLFPSERWASLRKAEAESEEEKTARSILEEIHRELRRAWERGATFGSCKKRWKAAFLENDWMRLFREICPDGRAENFFAHTVAPSLEIVFSMDGSVRAATEDWESHQLTKATRPWLRYTALLDARTRPEHAAWHGVILPVDHPWWKTHYPPNGWGCRCKAMSVGPDDLEAEGWRVTEEPPLAGSPCGIDPGFDCCPAAWGGKNPLPASITALHLAVCLLTLKKGGACGDGRGKTPPALGAETAETRGRRGANTPDPLEKKDADKKEPATGAQSGDGEIPKRLESRHQSERGKGAGLRACSLLRRLQQLFRRFLR